MGMNFYLHKGLTNEELHIGKSSCGWAFALHVIPEEGINGLGDWLELFVDPNNGVFDESETPLTAIEMMDRIMNRVGHHRISDGAVDKQILGPYSIVQEKHNGIRLLRCKVDGDHCIGHGIGDWDLITGEFS
jgi:hypothetical protein